MGKAVLAIVGGCLVAIALLLLSGQQMCNQKMYDGYTGTYVCVDTNETTKPGFAR